MERVQPKKSISSDIVVIGAGPAGAFFSYLMAKKGFSVTVLEARATIKRKVCGDYICPPGKDLLTSSGLEQIVKMSRSIQSMRIVTAANDIVDCPFPELNTGMSLSRLTLDTELVNAAKEVGVNFLFSESVQDLKVTPMDATVESKNYSVKAKLVVGADGRTSWVAKKLNLSKKTNSKRVAIRTFIKSKTETPHRAEMHLLQDNYIGINHIEDGLISVALVIDKNSLQSFRQNKTLKDCLVHNLKRSPELVSQFVDGWETSITEDLIDTSTPLSHSVTSTTSQRIALIGDAAGYVDPITGEGNFMALSSANALSSAINEMDDLNFNLEISLQQYKSWHKSVVKTKLLINSGFQRLIKHPRLIHMVGKHLNAKESRRRAFINLVGNVVAPSKAIASILL